MAHDRDFATLTAAKYSFKTATFILLAGTTLVLGLKITLVRVPATSDMESDQSYLSQLKDGQPIAYERLVEQFEGPLFRFFLCDHRDYHLAQEQTAETFAQLVRSLSTMKGEEDKLSAFVFGVARHIRMRR